MLISNYNITKQSIFIYEIIYCFGLQVNVVIFHNFPNDMCPCSKFRNLLYVCDNAFSTKIPFRWVSTQNLRIGKYSVSVKKQPNFRLIPKLWLDFLKALKLCLISAFRCFSFVLSLSNSIDVHWRIIHTTYEKICMD